MEFMDWQNCERQFIRKVEKDPERARDIMETAKRRLRFIESASIDDRSVSFAVEGYYEVIKELLVSLLLAKGLKSKNHQCLSSYFYLNYPSHEAEAHLIARLSYLRNRLDYYGELIEYEFYTKNKVAILETIKILTGIVEEEINTPHRP